MPHLATEILKEIVNNKQDEVEEWFQKWNLTSAPFFYSSVDLRRSCSKIVPVDTNLFPAGFNTLSLNGLEKAKDRIQGLMAAQYPDVKTIMIVPENHTRNLYYLENVFVLSELIKDAGFEVVLASLEAEETTELTTANDNSLTIHKMTREGNKVSANGITPDFVLVNNDLTSGAPEILKDLDQPVSPPVGLGWYQRRKSKHFDVYAEVARSFANTFRFDVWLISSVFEQCGEINFKERTGVDCVAKNIENVLKRIQTKYDEYNIKDEPYVFIKSNFGTYGMGIMTARSPEEFLEMNKKARKNMSNVKEGEQNTQVVVQEGIPTIDTVDNHPAEPMIYLVGNLPVGCTYRINEEKDSKTNLNSRGMRFSEAQLDDNMCPIQGLVARLAVQAAMLESYEPGWII